MITRRQTLKLLGLASAATALPNLARAAATRSGLNFGVQMYTVRDHVADLPAILKLIHSIGYASIEGYPVIYNRPARALRQLVGDSGLAFITGHFDFATLDEKLDYASELGLKTIICPWIDPPMRTPDGFARAAERFNRFTEKAAKQGIEFGYHFHNYEFKPLGKGPDAPRGFDILMRNFDPRIRIELDVYWVTEAGQNPLTLMKTFSSRLRMVHIKDRIPRQDFTTEMLPGQDRMTEAGKGTIDWPAVLRLARKLGVKEYYVDQDYTSLPIDECLRRNWDYLANLPL